MGSPIQEMPAELARQKQIEAVVERLFQVIKKIHHAVPHHDVCISHQQAQVLFKIASHGEEGISARRLADKLNVTPGAITQFVDKLIQKGLVKREPDERDRRVIKLKITDTAREQFETLRKEHLAAAAGAFEVLSDEEVKRLSNILAKIDSGSESGPHHR